MWFIAKQVIALIVSALMTVFPSSEFLAGFEALELATKSDDCRLNAAIVSDIHIDVDWAIGEWVWETGLKDLARSKDTVDALIVSGDLTNYGDAPSMESFFKIMADSYSAENWVIAMGNHDVGHVEDRHHEQARQ